MITITIKEPIKIPESKSLKNMDPVVFSRSELLSGLLSYPDDGKPVRNKHAYDTSYRMSIGIEGCICSYAGVQKDLAYLP